MRLAGREDVDDSAANGELAVLVGRIFTAEPGIDEQFREIGRCNVLPGLQLERRRGEPLRSSDAWQQPGGGGDDDAGGAMGEGMQRARTRRRDADVRREAAVWIDFVGREGQDSV